MWEWMIIQAAIRLEVTSVSCGFDKALFLAETDIDSDYSRWMGFKQAMEKEGKFCSRTRLIVIPGKETAVSEI